MKFDFGWKNKGTTQHHSETLKSKSSLIGILFFVTFSAFSGTTDVFAETSFEFNQDPHVIEHSGFVVYTNSSLANNNATDTIVANFTSQSNPTGLLVTLEEDEDNGILQSNYVKFSTSPGVGELLVAVGDWVHASYGLLSDNSAIVSDSSSLSWANARTDNHWADCSTLGGDSDNDMICNNWENQTSHSINGLQPGLHIDYPSGNGAYYYPCDPRCPDPEYKDIYLEIDFMEGHRPNTKTLQNIVDAFSNSPASNPNGIDGVNLHIQLDDSDILPHKNNLAFGGANHPRLFGFDQVKAVYYGTVSERNDVDWNSYTWKEKKQVFHYGIFAHNIQGNPGSSGSAELFGNDLMVSLGSWSGMIGSTDEQEGTLMHELGHNLNLHHGGAPTDIVNCKPNYLSVMNYALQFSDLDSDRDLDFSRKLLGTMINDSTSLVENNLNETNGIGSYSPYSERKIVFGPILPLILPSTGSTIDWNQDGDSVDSSLTVNINKIEDIGCTSSDSAETLNGYDDWDNLTYNSRGLAAWAEGASKSDVVDDEITIDNVKEMRLMRIASFDQAVQRLPSDNFVDKNLSNEIRQHYSTNLGSIKQLILNDDITQAMNQLQELNKKFDGDPRIRDDIINKKSQNYLSAGLEDILKSLRQILR